MVIESYVPITIKSKNLYDIIIDHIHFKIFKENCPIIQGDNKDKFIIPKQNEIDVDLEISYNIDKCKIEYQ